MEKAFLTAHAATNHANKYNKRRGVSFVSTNAAGTINSVHVNAAPVNTTDLLPQVYTYMENIVAVATTNHETFGALVASTERLATTNSQQQSTIKYLKNYIKELLSGSNTAILGVRADTSGHSISVVHKKQVIQDLVKGWYNGVFFYQPTDLE